MRESPPVAALVRTAPERLAASVMVATEGNRLRVKHVEFGSIEQTATLIGIFPNEEHFIDGVECVNLEFVIGITAIDEYFNVIFKKNDVIPFGKGGLYKGFLNPEAYIQTVVIPQGCGSRVVKSRMTADDIYKTRRTWRQTPRGLLEIAVNLEGFTRTVERVWLCTLDGVGCLGHSLSCYIDIWVLAQPLSTPNDQ